MPILTPHVPDGLVEIMKNLAKEVLKEKPENICEFAAVHFEKMLLERDGKLDKGYEQFTITNKIFKRKEKYDFVWCKNFIGVSSKDFNTCKNENELHSLENKLRPKRLSARKPSDALLVIKEEAETLNDVVFNQRNGEPDVIEEQENSAAYKIQRLFKRFREKLKDQKKTEKEKIQLNEQEAASIIQRTFIKLFSKGHRSCETNKSIDNKPKVFNHNENFINSTEDSRSKGNFESEKEKSIKNQVTSTDSVVNLNDAGNLKQFPLNKDDFISENAIKIQKAYRGYTVRKSNKTQHVLKNTNDAGNTETIQSDEFEKLSKMEKINASDGFEKKFEENLIKIDDDMKNMLKSKVSDFEDPQVESVKEGSSKVESDVPARHPLQEQSDNVSSISQNQIQELKTFEGNNVIKKEHTDTFTSDEGLLSEENKECKSSLNLSENVEDLKIRGEKPRSDNNTNISHESITSTAESVATLKENVFENENSVEDVFINDVGQQIPTYENNGIDNEEGKPSDTVADTEVTEALASAGSTYKEIPTTSNEKKSKEPFENQNQTSNEDELIENIADSKINETPEISATETNEVPEISKKESKEPSEIQKQYVRKDDYTLNSDDEKTPDIKTSETPSSKLNEIHETPAISSENNSQEPSACLHQNIKEDTTSVDPNNEEQTHPDNKESQIENLTEDQQRRILNLSNSNVFEEIDRTSPPAEMKLIKNESYDKDNSWNEAIIAENGTSEEAVEMPSTIESESHGAGENKNSAEFESQEKSTHSKESERPQSSNAHNINGAVLRSPSVPISKQHVEMNDNIQICNPVEIQNELLIMTNQSHHEDQENVSNHAPIIENIPKSNSEIEESIKSHNPQEIMIGTTNILRTTSPDRISLNSEVSTSFVQETESNIQHTVDMENGKSDETIASVLTAPKRTDKNFVATVDVQENNESQSPISYLNTSKMNLNDSLHERASVSENSSKETRAESEELLKDSTIVKAEDGLKNSIEPEIVTDLTNNSIIKADSNNLKNLKEVDNSIEVRSGEDSINTKEVDVSKELNKREELTEQNESVSLKEPNNLSGSNSNNQNMEAVDSKNNDSPQDLPEKVKQESDEDVKVETKVCNQITNVEKSLEDKTNDKIKVLSESDTELVDSVAANNDLKHSPLKKLSKIKTLTSFESITQTDSNITALEGNGLEDLNESRENNKLVWYVGDVPIIPSTPPTSSEIASHVLIKEEVNEATNIDITEKKLSGERIRSESDENLLVNKSDDEKSEPDELGRTDESERRDWENHNFYAMNRTALSERNAENDQIKQILENKNTVCLGDPVMELNSTLSLDSKELVNKEREDLINSNHTAKVGSNVNGDTSKDSDTEENAKPIEQNREKAAINIQKVYRGYIFRKSTGHQKEPERNIDERNIETPDRDSGISSHSPSNSERLQAHNSSERSLREHNLLIDQQNGVSETPDNAEEPTEEVLEEPCIERRLRSAYSAAPTVESSDCETVRANSRSTIQDDLSEIESIDLSKYAEDSLEAMYYSLRKNEILLEHMHRRASEYKSADRERPILNPFEQPDSVEIMDKLQRDDSTNGMEHSTPEFVQPIEFKHIDSGPPSPDYISPHRASSFESPLTIATAKNKYFLRSLHEPSKSIEQHENAEETLDEFTSDTIREKMLAYSVSEADSDYFETPSAAHKTTALDDFNISTALEATTSSDTDSTIISAAATKIQAGARGFLTRRRLRRASMGTTISAADHRASFGNEAINESLEDLIEQNTFHADNINHEENAARRIQKTYRQYRYTRNHRSVPHDFRKTDTMGSNTSSVYDEATAASDFSKGNSLSEGVLGITDVKLEHKPNEMIHTSGTSDCEKSKNSDANSEENNSFDAPFSAEQNKLIASSDLLQKYDDNDSLTSFSLDEINLAARRMTLQRGDAVQHNSTPDDDSPSDVGKSKDGSNESDVTEGNVVSTDPAQSLLKLGEGLATKTPSKTSFLNKIGNDPKRPVPYQTVGYHLGSRQNSMPVQIDSEILRLVPKHLRKRIKSAGEDERKKRPLCFELNKK